MTTPPLPKPFFTTLYSLKKSRHILQTANRSYQKKWKTLTSQDLSAFEKDLESLDNAILEKNQEKADQFARRVEKFTSVHFKRSFSAYVLELIIALALALAIATLIRQVWFEPYEIPTGSMRPTFEEQDHLIVRKTTFGINFPLRTDHLYFDPRLVQRSSIVIFSGENIDLPDTDTTYFWIFPYKKRYIKRCMGKPGDTLYFYGGHIYGMDAEGNDLVELRDNPWLTKLEYLPFINFEGRLSFPPASQIPLQNQIYFKQMNMPIGRLIAEKPGRILGEIFDGTNWITDQPGQALQPHHALQTYMDFWGMRNFGMARLVTHEQMEKMSETSVEKGEKRELYLEIRHQPSLTFPPPRILAEDSYNVNILLTPYISYIPLQAQHLDALMDNMYTARFVVERGYATRYNYSSPLFTSSSPAFPGIPDGTYEFYYGKAYKILWGGIPSELPKDHPLYSRDPQNVQRLYNLGIEMSNAYSPSSKQPFYFPARYAYFREGDLYLLGVPIFKKEDPLLKNFLENEMLHQRESSPEKPYIAFRDFGPPMKDGVLDKEFLQTFGVKIPPKHYLCLGDNHAMSADSRFFGFVPEENLQGSPSLTIWPPSHFGIPNQKPYPWWTFPNVLVWSIALSIGAIFLTLHLRRRNQPMFRKLSR